MSQTQCNNKRLSHPVDFIERVANGHNWLFERTAEDEISICVDGNRTEYEVSFYWLGDRDALHIACAFHIHVPEKQLDEMHRLLTQVNVQLVMGHFDYWQDANVIMYRQALQLADGLHPSDAQVELLLMNALEACESHYQAFYMVCNELAKAPKALQYSLFETVGNA